MGFHHRTSALKLDLPGSNCRLVRFILACVLICLGVTDAQASCRLREVESLYVDAAAVTGMTAEQLQLLPLQYYVYDDGVVRTVFGELAAPCSGPNCHKAPRPFDLPSSSSIATTHRGGDFALMRDVCFTINCTEGPALFDMALSYEGTLYPPSLRPPIYSL